MWVAAAVIVAGVAGAAISSESQRKAASKASGASSAAAGQADATQRYMFDTIRSDFQPYSQMGTSALPSLYSSLGYDVEQITPEVQQAIIQDQLKGDQTLRQLNEDLAALKAQFAGDSFNGSSGHKRSDYYYGSLADLTSRIKSRQDEISGGKTLADSPLIQYQGKYYTNQPIAKMQESEAYKWQKQRGLEDLGRQLRMMGRGNSTVAANATGRFLGDLNAAESDKFQNNLWNFVKTGQGAAGSIGSAGTSAANNMSNIAMWNGENQANAALAKGQAQSNLYQGLANIPMQYATYRYLTK